MNTTLTKQSAVGTGEVKPLSPDERLLRKAVARCLKAQVAEVHGRLTDGVSNKGGAGSGNIDHEGRPGQVGGSGPGGPGRERSSKFEELGVIRGGKVRAAPAYAGDVHESVFNKVDDETRRFRTVNQGMGRVIVVWSMDGGKWTSGDEEEVTNYYARRGVEVVRHQSLSTYATTRKSLSAINSAVPKSTKAWDAQVMREIRPIWFGLFKKGGDQALKQIRKFPKHARKMAVFGPGEMAESVRVDVVVKGDVEGHPFRGNQWTEGLGGGATEGVFHGTSLRAAQTIVNEGLKLNKNAVEAGIFASPSKQLALNYALTRALNVKSKVPVEDRVAAVLKVSEEGFSHRTDIPDPVMGFHLERQSMTDVPPEHIFSIELYRYGDCVKNGQVVSDAVPFKTLSRKTAGHLFVPVDFETLEDLGMVINKATSPSIVIPDWIEDPDVLDALEREMFKFAQGIDQTTADALRDELMDGMENGETIGQLANRISDLSDEWVEGWRSEMIARTETARAFTEGHIEAWKSTGVVSRKVWVAAGDACPFCREMDGTVVDLEDTFFDQGEEQTVDWKDQEIAMGHDYSNVNGPPLHPNCIVYPDTPITTFAGLKKIKDVKEGGLVLTHRGRFRRVTKTFRHSYTGKVVKIRFGGVAWVTVTEDHPVLVGLTNWKWVTAKDVRKGDMVCVAGSQGFINVPVLSIDYSQVKSRAVYNLSVAEDESYIAKGMVVHNCRCVLIAELSEPVELSMKGGVGSGNFGHEGRPGEVGGSGTGGSSEVTAQGQLLSGREEYLVHYYKQSGYYNMNKALREGDISNPHRNKDIEELTAAINRVPSPFDTDATVYRGVAGKRNAKQFDKQDGTEIEEKGFLSTSTSTRGVFSAMKDTGYEAAVMLDIRVPKGSRAIDMEVQRETRFSIRPQGQENEYLFAPGQKMRITGSYIADDGLKHVKVDLK